ncbi:tRNA pseudouridine(13) synthase TruD, partial [Candidatus Woesearchaeota archaeon]|nr:tRNA pseudouridine(13) synthase TruD [Candidatus Woesearchaeota archaeon]
MYVLKQVPEDFIVEELSSYAVKEAGNYLLLKITKKGLNTEDVARVLAEKLKISRKSVGYAGTKDKHAITTQHFSVKGAKKEQIEKIRLGNVEIEFLGYVSESLALGMLIGNKFTITVRNLKGDEEFSMPSCVPNYYDEQRFQEQNARVGEALVRKEFKTACELVSKERRYQKRIEEHLARSPNDYVGAIRILHVPLLKMYLHAFQSRLWNE